MIKRQQRLQRIADVVQEYLAAKTAATWLDGQMAANPSFGRLHDWDAKAAQSFSGNLEATYIIRMYAEFEAGLRDYWATYKGRQTRPDMVTLIRNAVPTQTFTQDCVDDADDVRIYRNFLVHDMEEEPPSDMVTFTVLQAKKNLCTYFSCLNPRWR
jgi:hypothetical protein